MLKTIRFKSSLCQKLEADLRDKEEEIINAKSENFRLIKTVEMLQKNHQNHQKELESAEKIHNTNIEARLEHLEQIFTEIYKHYRYLLHKKWNCIYHCLQSMNHQQ